MQRLCPPADLASLVLPQTYGIRKKRADIYEQSEYIGNHQNPLLPRHWYLHLLLTRVTLTCGYECRNQQGPHRHLCGVELGSALMSLKVLLA